MVSMNQMRELIDEDDFSEFFDSSPQPSSSMTEPEMAPMMEKAIYQPDLNKPVHQQQPQQSLDKRPTSPRDVDIMKKLKEVDAFMADYSGVAMPREQIWKNSQLLSMDKLLEFDDEEQDTTPQPSPKPFLEPPKDPIVEKQQQQRHHHHHQQQQQPQPKAFNTNEALNMLINIQNSADDSKFDLIDGFLDKYKIEHKNPKTRPTMDENANLSSPCTLSNRMTATQLFEQIVTKNETAKVAPFCVQPPRANNHHQVDMGQMGVQNKNHDLMPSYSTYEALQNVEVCEPLCASNTEYTPQLDSMISSNKSDKARDNLYWERRRVNNEAAHRSRAKRKRQIEDKTERIQFYEEENPKLKLKLDAVLNECAGLKRKLAFFEKYEFK